MLSLYSRIPYYENPHSLEIQKRFAATKKLIGLLVFDNPDITPEQTRPYYSRFMLPAGMMFNLTKEKLDKAEPLLKEAHLDYQVIDTEKYQWASLIASNSPLAS